MSTQYYIKQTVLQKGGITNSKNIPTFLLKNFHDLTKTQSFSLQWWQTHIHFQNGMHSRHDSSENSYFDKCSDLSLLSLPTMLPTSVCSYCSFSPCKKKRIKINSPLPSLNPILFGLSASSHTHTPKSRQNKIHVHKITHSLLFQVLLVKD